MQIHKHTHAGVRKLTYSGDVIHADDEKIVALALWRLPSQVLPYVTLSEGDRFIETFYRHRYYNVFEIQSADGELKGWYANVTRPAIINADVSDIIWEDLALDVWMSPSGELLLLDEDEFEAERALLTPQEQFAALTAVDQARDDLRARWRDDMLARIARGLQTRGWRVGTAESCTAGMLGECLTHLPGSSAYFEGGIIAYSNELKQSLLNVPAAVLSEHGAVSASCAEAMASGARHTLSVEVVLSTTGIAGPDGGSTHKPVGLVYLAIESPEQRWSERHRFPHDRAGNKSATLDQALRMLYRAVRFDGSTE